MEEKRIREEVKQRYGQAVRAKLSGASTSCCGSAASDCGDPITANLYGDSDKAQLPDEALKASFGCGNPTALAELHPGEVVLDLGSGGGIDVLLSARRVAPGGKAYGLDMTPEMLELARANQRKAGIENVEFLQGTIEDVPLPDASVDVIISNCVVNLSEDKDRVLREAFRVLRSGGRLAISDMVLRRELRGAARSSMELWSGCIAGALTEAQYRTKLAAAGFTDVELSVTRTFGREDAEQMVAGAGCCGATSREAVDELDGAVFSSFVRARKPA